MVRPQPEQVTLNSWHDFRDKEAYQYILNLDNGLVKQYGVIKNASS